MSIGRFQDAMPYCPIVLSVTATSKSEQENGDPLETNKNGIRVLSASTHEAKCPPWAGALVKLNPMVEAPYSDLEGIVGS